METYIRARVSESLKTDFEALCEAVGVSASEQLRDLMISFIKLNKEKFPRFYLTIRRPENYEFGAWQVLIRLKRLGEQSWAGSSFAFPLPELPHRTIASDEGFRAAVVSDGDIRHGGHFIDGEWRGHIWTNGTEEERTPTTIENVERALTDIINRSLDVVYGSAS